jgi:hypothetical protein
MSTPDEAVHPSRWDWQAIRTKFYGWLAGVALMVFGGFLCSVAIGLILGVPAVAFGLFLTVTFAVSLAGSPVRTPTAMALFVCGLALVIGGRLDAPVEKIIASILEGRSVDRTPGILPALGLPMMFVGTSLVGLAVEWLWPPRDVTRFRRGTALTLIHAGAIALLVGALLSTESRRIADQPTWAWLAVPIFLGLGAGVRAGARGRLWLIVLVLSALTLPVTWMLLVARSS